MTSAMGIDEQEAASVLIKEQKEFMAMKFEQLIDDLSSYKELTNLQGVLRISESIREDLLRMRTQLRLPKWEEAE